MKTTMLKPHDVHREWYLVDAAGQTLGRLAVRIANLLRGRGKPSYTSHVDAGDFVVVINAAQVRLTGNKEKQKTYWSYSGYRGGRKVIPLARMRERHPERIIEKAVKGMLPRNKLNRAIIKRLKVYAGAEHPHAAQTPKPLSLPV